MSELEDKLSAILGDPQMMQQIVSLAQAMGQGQQTAPPQQNAPPPEESASPGFDPSVLRSLAGMAGKSSVDSNQQALLTALSPYLSQSRVSKLERAMRAAKIAGMASSFLGSGGLQLFTGR